MLSTHTVQTADQYIDLTIDRCFEQLLLAHELVAPVGPEEYLGALDFVCTDAAIGMGLTTRRERARTADVAGMLGLEGAVAIAAAAASKYIQ